MDVESKLNLLKRPEVTDTDPIRSSISSSSGDHVDLQDRQSLTLLRDLQLEKEAETVISVLQPGPLGIIEHKFSAQEIRDAKVTVTRAVDNWRRQSELEHANGLLKDYIYK